MQKKIINITLFCLTGILLSGCFIYDPVADYTKQRYTNAISYFNTFYNAQRAFTEAEDEVLTAQKEQQQKPGNKKPIAISQTARTKFTASIEKNSKILTFYPTSKWVDDALLMIGKAYSYMEDDVKAERKFLELFAKYPESDLIPEGQLWYGKSLIRQKKTEQGIKQLEDLMERTKNSNEEIAGRAAFELSEYYFGAKNFESALGDYQEALKYVSGSELTARIYFTIGLCYEELKNFPEAAQAFAKAEDITPSYSLLFQSQLRKAKAIAKQGRYDEAVDHFTSMLSDSKNLEYFSTIHFEIANTMYAKGDVNGAIRKYQFVDTSFARTDESAKSFYQVGQIYEAIMMNYDSARINYNRARAEYPSSEITQLANTKAIMFNKYLQLSNDLMKYDSLYSKGIADLSKADSAVAAQRDSLAVKGKIDSIQPETKSPSGIKSQRKKESERDSVIAVDSTNIKIALAKVISQKALIDSVYRSIIKTKFELAGLFFIELQQPDSALAWYNNVVTLYPSSEFAPRALFTIADLYRTYKNASKENLDSMYAAIIKTYPESPYAQEARKNLGLPIVKKESDSAVVMFESAEILADQKKIADAIILYKAIGDKFTQSFITPKALYTAGWYYENDLGQNDSALAVYRRVISKFPLSPYASSARIKVNEFDNEVKRLELEKQKKSEEEKKKLEEEQKKLEETKQKEIESQTKESKTGVVPVLKSDSLSVRQKL